MQVCTRNDDLDQVVAATPVARRKDLVFLQNGMLMPWLKAQGLEDNTQVRSCWPLTCSPSCLLFFYAQFSCVLCKHKKELQMSARAERNLLVKI